MGAGELVGLIPAVCILEAARAAGVADPTGASGLPTVEAREAAARSFRLERLDDDRVLEWHLRD